MNEVTMNEYDATKSNNVPALVDKSGAVYLPKKRELLTSSADFESIVTNHLPSNVSHLSIKLTQNPQFSLFQLLSGFGTISLLFVFLYIFFPKALEMTGMPDYWSIIPPVYRHTNIKYRDVRERANDQYQKKEFNSCVNTLAKDIDSMPPKDNTEIVYMFVDASYKSGMPDKKAKAYKLAVIMCKEFPDELCWQLFRVELAPELMVNNAQSYPYWKYEDIWAYRDRFKKDSTRFIDDLKKMDDDIENALKIAKKQQMPEYVQMLTIRKAQLLTTRWIIEGRGENYPDDDINSTGVKSREDAYSLGKSKEFATNVDMLKIQIFICRKLYDTVGAWYYWNGERNLWKKYLKNEIHDIDKKMQGDSVK